MKSVRGENYDFGSFEAGWAKSVKVAIAKNPELALAENQARLLESCKRVITSRILRDSNPQ